MEDAESTLLSSVAEDSKLALTDDAFEVVTLESDYQVQNHISNPFRVPPYKNFPLKISEISAILYYSYISIFIIVSF